jgi:hypothetical protein
MKQSINWQGLHSNLKLLRSCNVEYYSTVAYVDTTDNTSTLLQFMAGGRRPGLVGSINNRNHVRISRAYTGGAGFNSPTCFTSLNLHLGAWQESNEPQWFLVQIQVDRQVYWLNCHDRKSRGEGYDSHWERGTAFPPHSIFIEEQFFMKERRRHTNAAKRNIQASWGR